MTTMLNFEPDVWLQAVRCVAEHDDWRCADIYLNVNISVCCLSLAEGWVCCWTRNMGSVWYRWANPQSGLLQTDAAQQMHILIPCSSLSIDG